MPHKKHLYKASWKRADRKLKDQAIAALGGCCVKCGFSDYRALEFDHIHGDGFKVKGGTRAELRKHLRASTIHEVYQLLCCNCHAIKTYDNGEWSKGRSPEPRRVVIEFEGEQFPLTF
jgi:hypothetical protein